MQLISFRNPVCHISLLPGWHPTQALCIVWWFPLCLSSPLLCRSGWYWHCERSLVLPALLSCDPRSLLVSILSLVRPTLVESWRSLLLGLSCCGARRMEYGVSWELQCTSGCHAPALDWATVFFTHLLLIYQSSRCFMVCYASYVGVSKAWYGSPLVLWDLSLLWLLGLALPMSLDHVLWGKYLVHPLMWRVLLCRHTGPDHINREFQVGNLNWRKKSDRALAYFTDYAFSARVP